MKKEIKKYLASFLVMAMVSSCATNVPNQTTNKSITGITNTAEKIGNINVVSVLQEKTEAEKGATVLKVSEKGTDLRLNISFSEASSFKISANTDGVAEKKLTDVAKVDVYVLELPSAPVAGSDPFGTANANVFKSFTNVAKTDSGTGFNILIKGLPTNNTGKT